MLSRTELQRKDRSTNFHHYQLPPVDSGQNVPENSAQKDNLVSQAALQKISALEDELTLLRAQIAAVVSVQALGSIPSRKPFVFGENQVFFPLFLMLLFLIRVPVHSLL